MLHGPPAAGKTTLALKLVIKALDRGLNATYAPEWIKDYANRKYQINNLVDSAGVVGNQMMEINHAIDADYEFIVSCSSPALCTFYANYYSNNSWLSLIPMVKEWEHNVMSKGYTIFSPAIYLDQEEYRTRFNNRGRYEDFETCLKLQEALKSYLRINFNIDSHSGDVLKDILS